MDAYVINIFDLDGPAEARVDGILLARSERAAVMTETVVGDVVYFPIADVRTDLLLKSRTRTFCPFKGTATYWSAILPDGRELEDIAWSYERPLPESKAIGEHIGFDSRKVQVSGYDQPAAPLSQQQDNFTLWLLEQGWLAPEPEQFTRALAEQWLREGVPIKRLSVSLWTLHPELLGRNYTWWRDQTDLRVVDLPVGMLNHPMYINSPNRYVTEGRGGVRQRLDDPEPEFDFPIMADLREEGCTDYVAMPLQFSDGSYHVLTMASDAPDGFSTQVLGGIFMHAGVIARIYEVHAQRRITASLLETYLGARSAKRVLDGASHRGDGETIDAAILYCDLRGSTSLADRLPRDQVLEILNNFFEIAVGEIEAESGEVLKFVGDAVLAIFPVDGPSKAACENAVAAAKAILARMAEPADDAAAMQCVVALHYGDVMYGNVGAPARLDFTVAGRAVNEVTRMHEICKSQGEDCLLSDTIAAKLEAPPEPRGEHQLRGAERSRTLYSLPA